MTLIALQIELILDALLSGFPDKDSLSMFMRLKLDTALDVAAEAPDHRLRAYKVVTWAERTGNVRRLLEGMFVEMPGNPAVVRLREASHTWVLDSDAMPLSTPDVFPASTPDSTDVSSQATQGYLAYLYARYRYLDFRGMGMADRVPLQLPVTEMYVPLKAWDGIPSEDTRPHAVPVRARKITGAVTENNSERLSGITPLLDLMKEHRGLVILGDPGAGKTTLLKYLTVLLAIGRGAEVGLDRRLPVLVPISAYAEVLSKQDVPLQVFMADYYRNRSIDLPLHDIIESALKEGRALVMLDGLDEVQTLPLRALVVGYVEAFYEYQRQRGNKFIITSRIVGYRSARPVAEDLKECTLVDFDSEDILLFLEKWTQALEKVAKGSSIETQLAAAEEKAELLFALESNPGVRQLAANPLLLTILALMKRQGVLLPERRVQLYDQYLQTLLRHWNLSRGLDRRGARELDVLQTTRVLAPLALWMQETSPGAGLVKREELRRQLEAIYANRNVDDPQSSAEQLLADAHDFVSLLLERGAGEFGFIHLTFQEYLAAIAVAQHGQSNLQPVVDILARHIDDSRWREVALLTIGHIGIVQQRDEAASDVLLSLLQQKPGRVGAAVILAGEAVIDTWPGGVTQACRNTVETALLAAMMDSENISPLIRARAGSLLGALGDPRNLDEMVLVKGGPFVMGGERYDDERPQHTVSVESFLIARYPVTNQQYAQFVTATGYEPPPHWRSKRPQRELLNHPVVNVSWYDACAYCVWLSGVLGRTVRLPTEAEWEKAARGSDALEYPWGEGVEPVRSNCTESQIDGTSPVGCFPDGESPYGCHDMAGNVHEWTLSLWGRSEPKPGFAYPYNPNDGRERVDAPESIARTLRGGSYTVPIESHRCALRNWNMPDYRSNWVGFRPVSTDGIPSEMNPQSDMLNT